MVNLGVIGEEKRHEVNTQYSNMGLRKVLWEELVIINKSFKEWHSTGGRDEFLDYMIEVIQREKKKFIDENGAIVEPLYVLPSSKTIDNFISLFGNLVRKHNPRSRTLQFIHCFILSQKDEKIRPVFQKSYRPQLVEIYQERYIRTKEETLLELLNQCCGKIEGVFERTKSSTGGQSEYINDAPHIFYFEPIKNSQLVMIHMLYLRSGAQVHFYNDEDIFYKEPSDKDDIPIKRASGLGIPFFDEMIGSSITLHLINKSEFNLPIDFRMTMNEQTGSGFVEIEEDVDSPDLFFADYIEDNPGQLHFMLMDEEERRNIDSEFLEHTDKILASLQSFEPFQQYTLKSFNASNQTTFVRSKNIHKYWVDLFSYYGNDI